MTYVGEEGAGPGVSKKCFQVALRIYLDGGGELKPFRLNENERTYWFDEGVSNPEAFRACGVFLGRAVLNTVLVPTIFPRAPYELT